MRRGDAARAEQVFPAPRAPREPRAPTNSPLPSRDRRDPSWIALGVNRDRAQWDQSVQPSNDVIVSGAGRFATLKSPPFV